MSEPRAKLQLAFILPILAFLALSLFASVTLFSSLNGTRNQGESLSLLVGKKAPELPATALNEAMAKPLSEFAGSLC